MTPCKECGIPYYSCTTSPVCEDCLPECPRCELVVDKLIQTPYGNLCYDCEDEIDALAGDDPFVQNYVAEMHADWALSVWKDNR